MSDMLVKLWDIPKGDSLLSTLKEKNIVIRKPIGPEKIAIMNWVGARFGENWISEAENAFCNDPKTIYIAVREHEQDGMIIGEMLGFACYDATVKGFFGPMGVDENERGQGLGKALLLSCLNGMREDGYAYCVIGWVGPVEFYKKTCGAVEIEDSFPGIYRGMLSRN